MINGKRVAVVMPAYNAEKTLEMTVRELTDIVDIRILVDDSSKDQTAALSRQLGVQTFIHDNNYGYGRNQQTCYREALAAGADIVVMVHPDYQYTPSLVPAMAGMIASGVYDMVLGSRILGSGALKGGMPLYKYISNRFLTAFQNLFLGVKLSEYHTGFRAFSKDLLETLPLLENSDDFVFDNQMIAQAVMFGFRIGEISCPTKYFEGSLIDQFQAQRRVWDRRFDDYGQLRRAQMASAPNTQIRPDRQKNYAELLLRTCAPPLRQDVMGTGTRWMNRASIFLLLVGAGISIIWGISLERSVRGGVMGFPGIYFGTKCLLQGGDPYDVNQLERVYQAQGIPIPSESIERRQSVTLYVNLPTTFLFVAPFTFLPLATAQTLWLLLVVGSFSLAAFMMWRLGKNYAPGVSLLLTFIVLANCEIIFSGGNTAGLVVGLCVIAVWCLLKERFALLGVICLASQFGNQAT
jgi:hypothetical protein